MLSAAHTSFCSSRACRGAANVLCVKVCSTTPLLLTTSTRPLPPCCSLTSNRLPETVILAMVHAELYHRLQLLPFNTNRESFFWVITAPCRFTTSRHSPAGRPPAPLSSCQLW